MAQHHYFLFYDRLRSRWHLCPPQSRSSPTPVSSQWLWTAANLIYIKKQRCVSMQLNCSTRVMTAWSKLNFKILILLPTALEKKTINTLSEMENGPIKMVIPRNKYPRGSTEESQIKRKSHLKRPMSLAHYSVRIDFGLWGQPALEQPLTSSWLMRRLQQGGRGSTSSTELPGSWSDSRTPWLCESTRWGPLTWEGSTIKTN